MQTAALFVVFRGRKGLVPLWAGLLAALSTLTRYNTVYLFPGAIMYYACFERGQPASRVRALVLFLIGFMVVILPWLGFSMQHGQTPGGALFHNIAYDIYSSKGVTWDQYETQIQPQIHSLREVVLRAPTVVLKREFSNLVQHLASDIKRLLGWQVAIWCAFGLILSLWDGTWRRLLPLWIMGAFLFITLVPAAYSERYSLPLAPFYLILAGAAAASPRLVPIVKGWLFPLKWILALLPLCLSGTASVYAQREVLHKLPVEVLEAARVIKQTAPSGARIMARKPHIAYYWGSPWCHSRLQARWPVWLNTAHVKRWISSTSRGRRRTREPISPTCSTQRRRYLGSGRKVTSPKDPRSFIASNRVSVHCRPGLRATLSGPCTSRVH